MTAIVLLLIFSVIAWMLYRSWSIYQERFAKRRLEAEAREMAFFKAAQSGDAGVVVPEPISSTGRRNASENAAAAPPSVLLDAQGRLAYFMLKVELSDHEILARVDPVALTGDSATQPVRAALDFVVCRRDFSPVAVVMLQRPGEAPLRERVTQQIALTGIRVLRWPVSALPERAQVRAQILGQSPTPRSS